MRATMKPPKPHCFFFLLLSLILCLLFHATAEHDNPSSARSSIAFKTYGRATYTFDIFTLPLWDPPNEGKEVQLTDGVSVNFNGHFPSSSSLSMLTHLPYRTTTTPDIYLIYVTERNGSSSIFLDSVYYPTPGRTGSRSILEEAAKTESTRERVNTELRRFQVPLVGIEKSNGRVSMKDKPSLVGETLVYVSTHEDPGVPRASWAAVYSTQLTTGLTRRLTPKGLADFSPAVSPSGVWTAVASFGEKGWNGEVEELGTDIYIFLTQDGSKRVKIVDHGGWPSWADESTLYFHRRCEDGWWSVFKAALPENGEVGVDSVVTQRVTPPGLHAFTPAASPANKRFIAVATRRTSSEFRHIELFDVVSNEFKEITRPVSPNAHHFNPFIDPDGIRVGYHRCRGVGNGEGSGSLILENIRNPIPEISLFRVAGSFPSFSPDGDRIAYVNDPGLSVVNIDGSGLREVISEMAFTTAWDWKRKGVVYTSVGPSFATESTEVDIVSVNVDDENVSYKKLTLNGDNNAFPSPSPDGKWVVFRSARTGYKNLYIMDAFEGEAGGLYRLTEGPWTDTMCNWSPDGNWIAFASDRDNPGAGSFALYMVHPNGTGLHKLVQSGSGGRTNHPWFSPDSKYIVFTTDYAGVSAEPISNPHHYQPYGDIFVIRVDGSGIQKLTHNSYEDGTPAWGPKFMKRVDAAFPDGGPQCSFEDCQWLYISPEAEPVDVVSFTSSSAKAQCAH